MNNLWIGLIMVLVMGGALWAKGKVVKTEDGFKIKQVHTYYENRVLWGEGYVDHAMTTPITGIAVLAVGTGWTYSTVTDANGVFKVKVKPSEPFKIRVSDGNTWVDYDTEIAGVAEGTTVSELK